MKASRLPLAAFTLWLNWLYSSHAGAGGRAEWAVLVFKGKVNSQAG